MKKYTSEEIKNRLSNIGKAIGTIALEYISELEQEKEQLKQQVSYLENNLRVARKDREDLKINIANGLKEFVKEQPFTSLRMLANKEMQEENEQLQQKWLESEFEKSKLVSQIEEMKCCENCRHSYHDRYHTLQCICNCINFDKWELV